MAKPIIVELYSTAAGNIGVTRGVSEGLIFGDEKRDGGNVGDLLEYMFSGTVDENNPVAYDREEQEFVSRWRVLYDRSQRDVNIDVGLFALPSEGDPIEMALERRITDYITENNRSILLTKTEEIDGKDRKYHGIDLRIEDLSSGGRYIGPRIDDC